MRKIEKTAVEASSPVGECLVCQMDWLRLLNLNWSLRDSLLLLLRFLFRFF